MSETVLAPAAPANRSFDLGRAERGAVLATGLVLALLVFVAFARAATGLAPDHPHARLPFVIIHLASVLPAIPLGAYILVTRKGTARHRLLGKVWLGLMLITATSAIFIRAEGHFSWIHLFVPLTFHAAWKTIATARRGDIAGHRRHLVNAYVMALAIPGLFAFLPNRLMGAWLFG